MLSYAIYHDNAKIGSAQVRREGLYWRVCASCALRGERVLRVYAHNGETCVNLGVLIPEEGELRLMRRVSAERVRFDENTRLSTEKGSRWRAFSGTVEDTAVNGALLRGRTLAIPCEDARPFALMAHFGRFTIGTIDGKSHWCAELDASLTRLAPPKAENEKTVDNVAEYDRISTVS